MAVNKGEIKITEQVIVNCIKYPWYFIDNFCKIEVPGMGMYPFRLFGYQKQALLAYEENRFNFILKSRQLGFTTLAAAYSLWYIMKPGSNVLFLSKKEGDAMDILRKTKIMYENLPSELQVGITSSNATALEFKNKNRIESLPATERAGAGKSAGLIILDEFSGFPAAKDKIAGEDVWTSILPTVSTGGRVIVQSTPKGMGNQFYRLWATKNKFVKYRFHWTDHPEYGKKKKERARPEDGWGKWTSPWAREMMANMTKDGWAQEFDCDFVQSGRPVFDAEILGQYNLEECDQSYGCAYAVGVDLSSGSSKDYSVVQVINVSTGKQVHTYRSKDPLNMLGRKVIEICKRYNNAKLSFENNSGYGLAFIKEIKDYPNLYFQTRYDKKREKKTRKVGWNTNLKTKELMISDLNVALRKKDLRLVDSQTIREMRVFQYDDNDRMGAQAGFNDDCVMALAIAWQCAKSLGVVQENNEEDFYHIGMPSEVVSYNETVPAEISDFWGTHKQPRDWRIA